MKIHHLIALLLLTTTSQRAQEKPFPAVSTVDAPTIAGRPVQLDAGGKLLPWPMPEDTGYSYSSHFLTQWGILWDQYSRQRYHYFHCCFDFDRTTFEMQPDWHWANSTAYLRAMLLRAPARFLAENVTRATFKARWRNETRDAP